MPRPAAARPTSACGASRSSQVEASPQHTLSYEEVFLVLEGEATATIAGDDEIAAAGDCLIVPAGKPFVLRAGDDGLAAVCAMAAGGVATILPDGPTITPPWAA